MVHFDIELIWQSDLAIAVNKPAGLSTQAPAGADSLESRLIEQLDRGDRYLSFPHRLDRGVSGVLLVAFTKKAARLLSTQFATRKTRKYYLAIVEGDLQVAETDSGKVSQRWDDYIRKVDGQSLAEQCAESDPGAKLASTIVQTIGFDPHRNRSRLDLNPITGRMHQLRLQTALRGHPIVGDLTYGAKETRTDGDISSNDLEQSAGGRILLHADRIGFHHPANGRWLEIQAPCPF